MTKSCAHLHMEYLNSGHGIIEWKCIDCLEVLEAFEDYCSGR